MDNPFFDHPILNSPYDYPKRHWELDDQGQPTQQIIERRRRAEFITPIPKPKKRNGSADQQQIIFDEGKGLSTQKQQYDITASINRVRQEVDQWRILPTPAQVTPETARLLSMGSSMGSGLLILNLCGWIPRTSDRGEQSA
jgi:type III restriction enzyme